jgi:hypothetical protein
MNLTGITRTLRMRQVSDDENEQRQEREEDEKHENYFRHDSPPSACVFGFRSSTVIVWM